MFCSYQSYKDMYVCKGDCLLAQAKLGGEPRTVIFNPLLLVSSGEVTQKLGFWAYLSETVVNKILSLCESGVPQLT